MFMPILKHLQIQDNQRSKRDLKNCWISLLPIVEININAEECILLILSHFHNSILNCRADGVKTY